MEARIQELAAEHGIAREDRARLDPLVLADPQILALGEEYAALGHIHKALVRGPYVPIVGQPGEPITWAFRGWLQH